MIEEALAIYEQVGVPTGPYPLTHIITTTYPHTHTIKTPYERTLSAHPHNTSSQFTLVTPSTNQSLVVARRVAEASTRGVAPALLPFPLTTKGAYIIDLQRLDLTLTCNNDYFHTLHDSPKSYSTPRNTSQY